MTESRIIETFNTHLMKDEVIRQVATGRDAELATIVSAISEAAAAPGEEARPLIVYGERGAGKSFLMRMVEIACADIEGVACVLLPEEQYNLRRPHQLLQVVAARVRGEGWETSISTFDSRSDEEAWRDELQAFHAALDQRFGGGQGMAVVLLENFDTIVEKFFGARWAKNEPASDAAIGRRQAEERLRKLLSMRGGRFMLVASATGVVDMDYERPLFVAFSSVLLQSFTADVAISYFNKRRQLYKQEPLTGAQEARARTVVEFIGGNARLAQLLGDLLASPTPRSISMTFDELADKLADYYRQRMDAMPPTSADIVDALIKSGEPATQSELAQRMNARQNQIADAFSYLVKNRFVRGNEERGGAGNLYRIRDRLFVYFYRRRHGKISSLSAIAELLERFFTPDEREGYIRDHCLRGEFEDARAFGRLPLAEGSVEDGYCSFRDNGITDGPARHWFYLLEMDETAIEQSRQQLRDQPDQAYQFWWHQASQAVTPLQQVAAMILAAVAASRMGSDAMAKRELEQAVETAMKAGDADALLVARDAFSGFLWYRPRNEAQSHAESLTLLANMVELLDSATQPLVKTVGYRNAASYAWHKGQYGDAEAFARIGLQQKMTPLLQLALCYHLAWVLQSQNRVEEALQACDDLFKLACQYGSKRYQLEAWHTIGEIQFGMKNEADAMVAWLKAVEVAASMGAVKRNANLLQWIANSQRNLKDFTAALACAKQGQALALGMQPPNWAIAADCGWLIVAVLNEQAQYADVAEPALAALDFARRANSKEVVGDILGQFVYAACQVPLPAAMAALAVELANEPNLILDLPTTRIKDNWPWMIVQCQAWPRALALVQQAPALLSAIGNDWRKYLAKTGKAWSDAAQQQGRAQAYAMASSALVAIKAIFDLSPIDENIDANRAKIYSWQGLTDELTRHCDNADFLGDIADLLLEELGDPINEQAELLRKFAGLHAAPDKERYLQRLDPDLAIAMRRIWNLPEPPDNLEKRGLRK